VLYRATFLTKACVLHPRGPTIKFQVWDTAGQERYLSLAPIYYRSAQAAIVVYDVTSASSFGTMKNWVMELQKFGPPGILVTIAGNKVDLEDSRQVPYEKGKSYADDIGALFYECSAKTEENVVEMFEEIGRKMSKEHISIDSLQDSFHII
jgi:Ras-related protein Rab-5C